MQNWNSRLFSATLTEISINIWHKQITGQIRTKYILVWYSKRTRRVNFQIGIDQSIGARTSTRSNGVDDQLKLSNLSHNSKRFIRNEAKPTQHWRGNWKITITPNTVVIGITRKRQTHSTQTRVQCRARIDPSAFSFFLAFNVHYFDASMCAGSGTTVWVPTNGGSSPAKWISKHTWTHNASQYQSPGKLKILATIAPLNCHLLWFSAATAKRYENSHFPSVCVCVSITHFGKQCAIKLLSERKRICDALAHKSIQISTGTDQWLRSVVVLRSRSMYLAFRISHILYSNHHNYCTFQ